MLDRLFASPGVPRATSMVYAVSGVIEIVLRNVLRKDNVEVLRNGSFPRV